MRVKIIAYAIFVFTVVSVVGILIVYKFENRKFENTPNPLPQLPEKEAVKELESIELPDRLNLKVPFTPQAPTANWDTLHNEACEEVSSIMVSEYFSKNENSILKPEFVEEEIQKLTKWQQGAFGYNLDTTSEETAKMITEVYGLKTEVVNGISEETIKKALASGKLVVISFDGRLLANPNYKRPGPPHHMLVIRGYNKEGFVTNDPGTRRGMNYSYSFETLENASGDWSHNTNSVDLRDKKMILVDKLK